MATTYTTHYNFGKPGNRDPGYGPVINADLDAIDAALYSLSVNKLDSSSYNASDILSKLLTADGAGSGLDADKLDGQEGSYYAAAAHVHGNISNAGYVGSAANIPLITGTDGIVQAGSFGSTANTFCQGNDARLSDARTPTSHAHGNISNTGYLGSSANIPLITGTDGIIQAGSFGTGANNFAAGNHTHASLYQPLENQRLSTTDIPTFSGAKIGSVSTVTWKNTYVPIEFQYGALVGRNDSGSMYFVTNAYNDATDSRWKYKDPAPATIIALPNGSIYFGVAPSGALSNNPITWTYPLQINNDYTISLNVLSASTVISLDANKKIVSTTKQNLIADPSGQTTDLDVEARTAINSIIDSLIALNLMSAS